MSVIRRLNVLSTFVKNDPQSVQRGRAVKEKKNTVGKWREGWTDEWNGQMPEGYLRSLPSLLSHLQTRGVKKQGNRKRERTRRVGGETRREGERSTNQYKYQCETFFSVFSRL